MQRTDTLKLLARILSALLNPVLIPAYLLALLLCEGLLLNYATTENKLYFSLVIVLNTVIVPSVCIFLFERIRFWNDGANSGFRERILPMVVMTICYMGCLIMIRNVPFALPVRKMLTAGIFCLMLGLTVSFFWKISLHMIAQGAAVAFIGMMIFGGAVTLLPILCAAIAVASLAASALLLLGRNDWMQTGAGFLGGLVSTVISIYLI